MAAVDKSGLPAAERESVRAALERDPALARELEMILGQLGPVTRTSFWRALAKHVPTAERPASAVLEALAEAARTPRD